MLNKGKKAKGTGLRAQGKKKNREKTEPGTRNQESRIKNQEPGTKSQE